MIKYLNYIYDIIILFIAILIKSFLFKFQNKEDFPIIPKNKKTIIIVNGPSLKKDMKNILYKKKILKIVLNFMLLIILLLAKNSRL